MDKVSYMRELEARTKHFPAARIEKILWDYELQFKRAALRGDDPDELAKRLPPPRLIAAREQFRESFHSLSESVTFGAIVRFVFYSIALFFLSVLMVIPMIIGGAISLSLFVTGISCWIVGILFCGFCFSNTYEVNITLPTKSSVVSVEQTSLYLSLTPFGFTELKNVAPNNHGNVTKLVIYNQLDQEDAPPFLAFSLFGLILTLFSIFFIKGLFRSITHYVRWTIKKWVSPFSTKKQFAH